MIPGKYSFPLGTHPGKQVFPRPRLRIVARESGKTHWVVPFRSLIKQNPARTNPGGAVKIPLLGDTMGKKTQQR